MKKLTIGQTVYATSCGTYIKSKVAGFRKDYNGSKYIQEVYLHMPYDTYMYWDRALVLTEEEFNERIKPRVCSACRDYWVINK